MFSLWGGGLTLSSFLLPLPRLLGEAAARGGGEKGTPDVQPDEGGGGAGGRPAAAVTAVPRWGGGGEGDPVRGNQIPGAQSRGDHSPRIMLGTQAPGVPRRSVPGAVLAGLGVREEESGRSRAGRGGAGAGPTAGEDRRGHPGTRGSARGRPGRLPLPPAFQLPPPISGLYDVALAGAGEQDGVRRWKLKCLGSRGAQSEGGRRILGY